jgi:hypothetical protein
MFAFQLLLDWIYLGGIHVFELFHGNCPFKCDIPSPAHFLVTDACESGGGGFYLNDWFYENWLIDYPEKVGAHINELELFTVVLALRRWGPHLAGEHVRIRSDNSATVAALNKTTSRSATLMVYIREIFWLAVANNITISCVHIPGRVNYVADRISRLNEFSLAMDARLLLANFSPAVVTVKHHMSWSAFVYLQELWTQSLPNFVGKRQLTSVVH